MIKFIVSLKKKQKKKTKKEKTAEPQGCNVLPSAGGSTETLGIYEELCAQPQGSESLIFEGSTVTLRSSVCHRLELENKVRQLGWRQGPSCCGPQIRNLQQEFYIYRNTLERFYRPELH